MTAGYHMSQERQQGRVQGQSQLQAQLLRQQINSGFDDLDDSGEDPIPPGPQAGSEESGYDDEVDGDALAEDSSGVVEETTDVGLDMDDDGSGDPPALAEIVGRRPRVLLHLTLSADGSVLASPCVDPAGEPARQALAEMRADVCEIFNRARSRFSDTEWGMLMGTQEASVIQRFVLLARAASPAKGIFANVGGLGRHSLHDRVLARYGKFAVLPDGTPFSLSLVVRGEQGRKPTRWFQTLPDTLKLLAYEKVRHREQAEDCAFEDRLLAGEIEAVLRTLGLEVPKGSMVTALDIQGFRFKLARKGLGNLLPKASERRHRQKEGAGEPPEGPRS